MHRATYRFFDAAFTIETDDAGFLARFDCAYRRFRVAADSTAPRYRVRLGGRPELALDGDIWRAADPAALGLFAYNAILNAATARVRSHFLFHAAALAAPDGAGVVIAGDAGLGKTTLTLALLRHGFRVFSDDVAAVGGEDGKLYPFPRPLAVRDAAYAPGEKRLLDPAGPEAAKEPCPLRRLFLLADGPGLPRPQGWTMVLDHVTEAFLTDLTELPGAQAAIIGRAGPYPSVTLDLAGEPAGPLEPAILALCRRHAILPFDIGPGPAQPPNFDRPPRLVHLPAVEAAEGLLHHLKGGPASALLAERFGGSPAALFLALAALTDRMACYRLEVGRLETSVALIRAVGEGG
jgi:hypothetical protein